MALGSSRPRFRPIAVAGVLSTNCGSSISKRTADLIRGIEREGANAEPASVARSPTITRASWMKRRSRSASYAPCARRLNARSRRSSDRKQLAHLLGAPLYARRRRCAEFDQLRHRPPVRPLGRAGPRRAQRYAPTCCRAGWQCRTATTTSRQRHHMARHAGLSDAHRA